MKVIIGCPSDYLGLIILIFISRCLSKSSSWRLGDILACTATIFSPWCLLHAKYLKLFVIHFLLDGDNPTDWLQQVKEGGELAGEEGVALTGDVGGGVEDAEDLGVHQDGHVVLLHQLLVPGLHPGVDPVGERLAHQGVGHVDDPLAGQLAQVFGVREVLPSVVVLAGFGEELLDAEALVLGHRQVLDLVGVDELLGAGDEGLEEVDGDVLVGREVGPAVHRREVVPREEVS